MQLDANNEVIDSDIMYFASTRLCHSAYLSTCFLFCYFFAKMKSHGFKCLHYLPFSMFSKHLALLVPFSSQN